MDTQESSRVIAKQQPFLSFPNRNAFFVHIHCFTVRNRWSLFSMNDNDTAFNTIKIFPRFSITWHVLCCFTNTYLAYVVLTEKGLVTSSLAPVPLAKWQKQRILMPANRVWRHSSRSADMKPLPSTELSSTASEKNLSWKTITNCTNTRLRLHELLKTFN